MKMEPTVSSGTWAIRTQTPGNYPKRNKLHLIKFAVMEEYSYTSTHLLGHTGPVTGSLYLMKLNIEFKHDSTAMKNAEGRQLTINI